MSNSRSNRALGGMFVGLAISCAAACTVTNETLDRTNGASASGKPGIDTGEAPISPPDQASGGSAR